MRDPASARVVRFSVFEVDLASGELRKRGVRVPLQQQPFLMLVDLLERPGEVVTREALQQDLWPGDTFVDFEHGLNAAAKRLRDALGDSAETPRFIETLPRRGYRFIAPVLSNADDQAADAAARHVPTRVRLRARWLRAGIALTLAGAGIAGWWTVRRPVMTQADAIVLADVDNQTTEPVLTGTVRQALAVKLSESHFINLVSEETVRQTLRMMRRKPDEPLTLARARDVCQRVGATATLSGEVAAVGSSYVISVTAALCSTGEVLARDQARASRKEDVLPALDGVAMRLRRRLGESLPAINAANAPLERATTSSLDALKAFTEAERRFWAGRGLEAIPFYKRAIELDPEFAMAHAKLSVVYFNVGMPGGIPELARAFELRERLTEREQFYVTAHYHRLAESDLEAARSVYEVWKTSYPRDPVPYTSLGFIDVRQGQLDRALAEFEAGAGVAPIGFMYSNLLEMYLYSGRAADAQHLLDRWERDSGAPIHYGRFLLAFAQGDRSALEAQGSALRTDAVPVDDPDAARARAFAFFGRMGRARELFATARRNREGADVALVSSRLALEEAVWEAEIGNCRGARERVAEGWTPNQDRPGRALMTIALAECGDVARAGTLAEEQNGSGWLETDARARIDLARGRFQQVLETLKPFRGRDLAGILPYDLAGQGHGLAGVYLRGRAHLGLGQGREATADFREILDHPGIAAFAPYHALASLYLARAHACTGDVKQSREAYEQFLSLWKEADVEIPIVRTAREEYARMSRP